MRHLIYLPVILATLLITAPLLSARIYIWTDAEGVKHFSQEPPPENASEVMVHDEVQHDASADAKQHRTETAPVTTPSKPPKSRAKAGPQQTAIVVEGNVILVPATIVYNGRKVNTKLVLDTGASSTVLHAPLADRLGIRPEMNAKVRVASGESINAQAVTMEKISVGPHTAQGLRTLIIRHQGPQTSHQGLLGLNFLGQYPYTIDMRNKVIIWGTAVPVMGP